MAETKMHRRQIQECKWNILGAQFFNRQAHRGNSCNEPVGSSSPHMHGMADLPICSVSAVPCPPSTSLLVSCCAAGMLRQLELRRSRRKRTDQIFYPPRSIADCLQNSLLCLACSKGQRTLQHSATLLNVTANAVAVGSTRRSQSMPAQSADDETSSFINAADTTHDDFVRSQQSHLSGSQRLIL